MKEARAKAAKEAIEEARCDWCVAFVSCVCRLQLLLISI
jgi:hypothetical protein